MKENHFVPYVWSLETKNYTFVAFYYFHYINKENELNRKPEKYKI